MSSPAPGTPRTPVTRSVWLPVLVSVVAALVALVAWLATRDDGSPTSGTEADPAAGTSSPTVTTVDDAPGSTTEEPGDEDAAAAPEAAESTDGSEGDGIPEDAEGVEPPAAPQVARPGEPVTVNGVEVTPPAAGEFTFPVSGEDSWAAPLEERGADGPYALGDPEAPVVMLMYSEFQCPFCRSFSTETMPELMPYVDDGTLQVIWRDFPYLGPESSLAALGGRTAAEQDMFWEFHDELFALDVSPNTGDITEDSLAEVAERAGLDREEFVASLNTIEQQEAMLDDQDEGLAMGVVGTPSFLINGIPIRGAQPTEIFVRAVEDAAAAREQ